MIFVPVRGTLRDGKITLQLNKPLYSCQIGLLDFSIPSINERHSVQNSLDITCDQIDSTVWNPKRILKRICFDRVTVYNFYNLWNARVIEFHPIDSADTFLTFNIQRTLGTGEVVYEVQRGNVYDPEIFFTIVIKPIKNEESRWTCI